MIAEFGATPWGRAWLGLAERPVVTVDTRLPVARRLSRRGAVRQLDLAPGLVAAKVHHREDFQLRLVFPTWTRKQLVTAAARIKAHPLASRFLSAGDAPDDLAASLVAAGVPIAPTHDQVTADCSCDEGITPCLHALVCCYALVRRLDEEPALTFSLHGYLPVPLGEAAPLEAWIALDRIHVANFFDSPRAKRP